MQEKIIEIKSKAIEEISEVKNKESLFDLEKKYLGRKSEFNDILKNIKNLSEEEKRKIGQLANSSKIEIQDYINKTQKVLEKDSFDFEKEKIDVTIPGKKVKNGHLHILSQVRNEIEDIFTGMGFEIADGPEIETEWYNFDALNVPKDHPARDMQDTFWLKQKAGDEKLALRTQTSTMQIRYMQKNKPPLRIIAPGKCFRREATDSTHDHTFYQFEALVVGEDVNVGNLKHIAEQFFSKFFERDVKIRLRPSYFPFVEPGFEFDINCLMCGGKGCRACKDAGWLELGGAGMVNQAVFVAAGYPRNKYQGFAWGFGLERLAMMKYKIDDVRLFHGGDLRFIQQF
ncbi:MAG: phenylalanine--tRNA ligase subunit alpha [Parcubacteria group bacterium]|jgi:phenylalanyl-tRNA synthetase alpha chain